MEIPITGGTEIICGGKRNNSDKIERRRTRMTIDEMQAVGWTWIEVLSWGVGLQRMTQTKPKQDDRVKDVERLYTESEVRKALTFRDRMIDHLAGRCEGFDANQGYGEQYAGRKQWKEWAEQKAKIAGLEKRLIHKDRVIEKIITTVAKSDLLCPDQPWKCTYQENKRDTCCQECWRRWIDEKAKEDITEPKP
jgi:hypothetical protein